MISKYVASCLSTSLCKNSNKLLQASNTSSVLNLQQEIRDNTDFPGTEMNNFR